MASKKRMLNPVDAKVSEARKKMEMIKEVKEDFAKEGEMAWLEFPGLESCGVLRPPKKFHYCGRRVFDDILDAIYLAKRRGKNFILTGSKGTGKSSLLRALATQLIVVMRALNNDESNSTPITRIVCFWYFDASKPLAEQVQDALLFTYFNEDEATLKQISGIETWQEAALFLAGRRKEGERIWLITDGEERLDDTKNSFMQRGIAQTWLSEISRQADFIIKALSPDAEELKSSLFQGSPEIYCLDMMLNETERTALIKGTALGWNLEVYPHRQVVVDEIAGYHPLSLSILMSYCSQATGFFSEFHHANDLADDECSLSKHQKIVAFKQGSGQKTVQETPSPVETHQGGGQTCDPLLDETAWSQVVDSFKRDKIFAEMRKSVQETVIHEEVYLLSLLLSFTRRFPAYVVKDEFCTPWIRQIHTQEAGAKLAFANEAWSNYVWECLQDGRGLNWIKLGWLCENFVSQVIQARGLKLAELDASIRNIQHLRMVHHQGLEPLLLNTADWKDGDGVIIFPDKYFFKYVDFVVVQKRGRIVCIDGGQVTMDPDSHCKTEKRFVEEANIKRWVGDAECDVHYVYLCPQ